MPLTNGVCHIVQGPGQVCPGLRGQPLAELVELVTADPEHKRLRFRGEKVSAQSHDPGRFHTVTAETDVRCPGPDPLECTYQAQVDDIGTNDYYIFVCDAAECSPSLNYDFTVTCTPTDCPTLGYNCDTWDDGCGVTLDCGTCTSPETCQAGTCAEPPPPPSGEGAPGFELGFLAMALAALMAGMMPLAFRRM